MVFGLLAVCLVARGRQCWEIRLDNHEPVKNYKEERSVGRGSVGGWVGEGIEIELWQTKPTREVKSAQDALEEAVLREKEAQKAAEQAAQKAKAAQAALNAHRYHPVT